MSRAFNELEPPCLISRRDYDGAKCSRKDPPRPLVQQSPRRELPAPGSLDAPGNEAIQRIGPQTVFLAHFELGPGDDPPGRDVLPAVGVVVAVEGPSTFSVDQTCSENFLAGAAQGDVARPELRIRIGRLLLVLRARVVTQRGATKHLRRRRVHGQQEAGFIGKLRHLR